MNARLVERALRVVRAALVLGLAAYLGWGHASYWTIALIGLAMASFQVQANFDQWIAMIRGAGLRAAGPGLIVAFVSQVVYAALFYAIGFTIGVAHGDPPVAPYPTLHDLALIGVVEALGLSIGAAVRRRA